MEMLTNGSIDGFIMSLSAGTQKRNDFNHLREVTEQGIPLVLFDRVTEDVACDKVILNDEDIAHEATQSLLAKTERKSPFLPRRIISTSVVSVPKDIGGPCWKPVWAMTQTWCSPYLTTVLARHLSGLFWKSTR